MLVNPFLLAYRFQLPFAIDRLLTTISPALPLPVFQLACWHPTIRSHILNPEP
jgi:hypothetical protein